jgi:hypothetical protein
MEVYANRVQKVSDLSLTRRSYTAVFDAVRDGFESDKSPVVYLLESGKYYYYFKGLVAVAHRNSKVQYTVQLVN